jgi:hypothetical protein
MQRSVKNNPELLEQEFTNFITQHHKRYDQRTDGFSIKEVSNRILEVLNVSSLVKSDRKSIFIEFKNGCVNKKEEFDIRKKIYDSLLLLTDIINR